MIFSLAILAWLDALLPEADPILLADWEDFALTGVA
jgi:hypothetical protein